MATATTSITNPSRPVKSKKQEFSPDAQPFTLEEIFERAPDLNIVERMALSASPAASQAELLRGQSQLTARFQHSVGRWAQSPDLADDHCYQIISDYILTIHEEAAAPPVRNGKKRRRSTPSVVNEKCGAK